jgi:hypothetical protein
MHLRMTIRTAILAILSVAALSPALASPDSDYATGQRTYLTPAIGGRGGAPFRIECQNRDYLVGVNLRFDGWLDQIDGLCAMFRSGMTVTQPQEAMGPGFNSPPQSGWSGAYGAAGLAAGGLGGRAVADIRCPSGMVVTNLKVSRSVDSGMIANVSLTCAEIGGPGVTTIHQNPQVFGADETGWMPGDGCKSDQYWYYAARGLHGRAGSHVDAIGLICSAFRDGKFERPSDQRAAQAASALERQNDRLRDSVAVQPPLTRGGGQFGDNALGRAPRYSDPANSRPSADTPSRFDNPVLSAERRRTRLDWCLRWGEECGKPAADAYCRHRDPRRPYAADFSMAQDIGRTQIISSGEICADPGCDGFAHITCANAPAVYHPPR